jgi:hypothetical protein
MQLPKWAVVLLGLAFNTVGGLMTMGMFPVGSRGAIVLTVINLVVGNAVLLFGIPIVGGKAMPLGDSTTLTLQETHAAPLPLPPIDTKVKP